MRSGNNLQDIADLLIIEPVGNDAEVISARHDLRKRNRLEERMFKEKLSEYDHFIFEGSRESNELSLLLGLNGYQTIAFKMYASKHFLEENSDLVDKINSYGINEKLYYLLNTLFHVNIDVSCSPREINDKVNSYAEIQKHLSSIQEDKINNLAYNLYKMFRQFQVNHAEKLGLLKKIGSEFLKYASTIKDYEVLGPRSKNLVDTLEGKKAIIIGPAHFKSLVEYLKYGTLEKPKQWKDYVNKLPKEYKETIDIIENEIIKNKKELSKNF